MIATRGLAVAFTTLALLVGPGASPVRAERITAQDGRLTVKVEAMRADRVLSEIARLTGIRISASPAVLNTLITADVADVETEAALARVVAGYDRVLVFALAAEAGLRPALKEVRLFAAATTRSAAAPVSGIRTGDNDVAALLASLHDPDPAVRAASIEALGRSGDEVPVDRVLAAGLADHDPRGRLAVLISGFAVPRDVLVDRAMYDASPMVRAEALAQLPRNDPRVEAVARAALADQDAGVRDVAQDVLAALRGRQAGR